MRRFTSALGLCSALAATILTAGCPNREVTEVNPNQQKEEKKLIPVGANRDIDILFVIDNSQSMEQEQAALQAQFPLFMSVLRNIEGGLPNVHIGVVSSNVGVGGYSIGGCGAQGDNGELQNVARGGCSPPTGKFISDVSANNQNMPDQRIQNYSGTLEDTFACIAALGTGGCGFEQHLESMKRALNPGEQPANAGFIRDGAYLAVIIIADEDDCSAGNSMVFDPSDVSLTGMFGPLTSFRCTEFGITCDEGNLSRTAASYTNCVPRTDVPYMRNPQDYVDFLKGLKADPNLIIVAGIIGNADPVRVQIKDNNPELDASCSSANGNAAPAVRLKYFLDQFPNHNTLTSICNDDLSGALEQIAQALARVIGNPCLEGNIPDTDINPNEPGIQLECSVADVQYPGTEQEIGKTIRRCDITETEACIVPSTAGADPYTPPCPKAGQALPCWWTRKADSCDPDTSPSQLQLLVERAAGQDPPAGTYVVAGCVAN
jgi:hypothetical protein